MEALVVPAVATAAAVVVVLLQVALVRHIIQAEMSV